jgi:hypothetical protein
MRDLNAPEEHRSMAVVRIEELPGIQSRQAVLFNRLLDVNNSAMLTDGVT